MDTTLPAFCAGYWAWAEIFAILVAIFALCQTIYNLYFHPLRHYPGPFLHRATRWAWAIRFSAGRMPFAVLAMHEKYGPVVRIAPNELAFVDPEAWKDIYGHRPDVVEGHTEIPKWNRFYKLWDRQPTSIINAGRDLHSIMRRALSHGFSDKAMREQEPMIGGYVDLLISRLKERCWEGPQNMTKWYNWTTFDVIGDLAFGESFRCLETAEDHPWVNIVLNMPAENAKVMSIRILGFPKLALLVRLLYARSALKHFAKTRSTLERRMQLGGRPDLIEGLLQKKGEEKLDFSTVHMTATTLVMAGSETTATLLCGVTYLLCTHPHILAKVTTEVRSSFNTENEITLTSVGNLSFMLACLNEALRLYPPVAIGFPRFIPAGSGGTMILGHYVPENTVVSVNQWSVNHYSRNWTKPFEFHPERFLGDERFAADKTDAMQPFSVGLRNCIGRNLAYSEMRLILARILFSFDMSLEDDSSGWLADQRVYVLWKKSALNVRLTPVR